MTGIEPELWVDGAGGAVGFYEAAFGATTLLRVGDGEDIVARLAVGEARFWVAAADPAAGRLGPAAAGGRTGRTLLLVDDPAEVLARAVAAGATQTSPVADEHGWRVGRLVDPYGHEWELAREPEPAQKSR
jgi:PhnB protein